jgi:hypothetical protein
VTASRRFVRIGDGEYVAVAHVARLYVERQAQELSIAWGAYAELANRSRVRLRYVVLDKPARADDVAAAGDAIREWLAAFVATLDDIVEVEP